VAKLRDREHLPGPTKKRAPRAMAKPVLNMEILAQQPTPELPADHVPHNLLRTPYKNSRAHKLETARTVARRKRKRARERYRRQMAIKRVQAWKSGDLHAYSRLLRVPPHKHDSFDPTQPLLVHEAPDPILDRRVAHVREHGLPRGVRFIGNGRWTASLNVYGQKMHLGTFLDPKGAIRAQETARAQLGLGPAEIKQPAEINWHPKIPKRQLSPLIKTAPRRKQLRLNFGDGNDD